MPSNGKQFVIIYSSFQLANRIVEQNDKICFFRGKFSIFSSLAMNAHTRTSGEREKRLTTVSVLFCLKNSVRSGSMSSCALGLFHRTDFLNRLNISSRSMIYRCLLSNEFVFRWKSFLLSTVKSLVRSRKRRNVFALRSSIFIGWSSATKKRNYFSCDLDKGFDAFVSHLAPICLSVRTRPRRLFFFFFFFCHSFSLRKRKEKISRINANEGKVWSPLEHAQRYL